jgi:hypothetical protein
MTSCKKAEDRSCFKGHGADTSVEIPLDSTNYFILNKRMKFRIFEDTLRKLVIRGGENVIGMVDVETSAYTTTITNSNKCHFLRDADRFIEVEIHYPYLEKFRLLTSDSVIFENTIYSKNLDIELYESGSSLVIDVDNNYTYIVVSRGTADYTLTGHSNSAAVKIQDNGYANAMGFTSESIFAFQGSTAPLKLNLAGSEVFLLVDGSGDTYYVGVPDSLVTTGSGSGNVIPQ